MSAIKIDYEIIRCKQRLDEIRSNLDTTFNKVNEEILKCSKNLVDSNNTNPLVDPIQKLLEQNKEISSKIVNNLNTLSEFLATQMEGYTVSTEDAQASIVKLITLIQSALGIATSEIVAEETLEESLDSSLGVESSNSVVANGEYKLATPMASTYYESAYNEGITDYQVALIQDRMGTVDALNDRMDVIVNSYNYYKELGYSDELIAGMLGNMCQESTFNLETVSSKNCKGLYQWTADRAPESWDLQSQLDRSVVEINTRTDMSGQTIWERLQNCSTVREYTEYFAVFFEGAASRVGEVPDIGARTNYANAMYYLIKNNFKV